ncbi:MAG: biotin/lipoate A/B protein ligase family protein [Aureliella sp.]
MIFVDETLPTVASNLAFEETLLSLADQSEASPENEASPETLRLWDARETFVVLGRGSKYSEEANVTACDQAGVEIFRRISGGATILAAKGCMFYAVCLSLKKRPSLRGVDQAHEFVMSRVLNATSQLNGSVSIDGICDLVIGNRKTSGNALRISRDYLLYHGTLLLNMNLDLVSQFLNHPPREPGYRQKRSHADFLTNLAIDRNELAAALKESWQATAPSTPKELDYVNKARIESRTLAQEKYRTSAWIQSR